MKDIIYYNYDIDINEMQNNNEYSCFNYNGNDYYFVFFNRSIDELNDLNAICIELKNKGIRVHDIIKNNKDSFLTKVGNDYYILLKINIKYNEIVTYNDIISLSNKLVLNNKNSRLYRNNWGELWSKKIDYFEYQIKEIGKNKNVILDSFSYYIGLAENAISYVNKVNSVFKMTNYDKITLSHRRIFNPNIALNFFNPLSFIFDLEVRDIAEYLKINFFNGTDSFLDLKTYLKIKRLSEYGYNMLFARLLYPSYYFDIYEKIMNKKNDEDELFKIIDKTNDYEIFLKKAYEEISKYSKLDRIEWLLKSN